MFQKTEAVTIHTQSQTCLFTLTVMQTPPISKIRDNDAAMENPFERHYKHKASSHCYSWLTGLIIDMYSVKDNFFILLLDEK